MQRHLQLHWGPTPRARCAASLRKPRLPSAPWTTACTLVALRLLLRGWACRPRL